MVETPWSAKTWYIWSGIQETNTPFKAKTQHVASKWTWPSWKTYWKGKKKAQTSTSIKQQKTPLHPYLKKHFVLMDRKQLEANIYCSWKTEVNYNSKWALQYWNRPKFKPCMAWFGHPTETGGGGATAAKEEACGIVLAHPWSQPQRQAAHRMAGGWPSSSGNLCSLKRGSQRPGITADISFLWWNQQELVWKTLMGKAKERSLFSQEKATCQR